MNTTTNKKVKLLWGLSASQEYDDQNKMPYVQIHLTKLGLTVDTIRINGRLSKMFETWGSDCVLDDNDEVVAIL